MKGTGGIAAFLCLALIFGGCGATREAGDISQTDVEDTGINGTAEWDAASAGRAEEEGGTDRAEGANQMETGRSEGEVYTADTRISEVIEDPVFGEYGRLIFPVDSGFYKGDTLGDLRLTWYNNIDPEKTVEIVNYLKSHAEAGNTVFYDIYTEEEKAQDPEKEDTGLFFFKGTPGEKFAVCNAGGGGCLCGRHAGQLSACIGII